MAAASSSHLIVRTKTHKTAAARFPIPVSDQTIALRLQVPNNEEHRGRARLSNRGAKLRSVAAASLDQGGRGDRGTVLRG